MSELPQTAGCDQHWACTDMDAMFASSFDQMPPDMTNNQKSVDVSSVGVSDTVDAQDSAARDDTTQATPPLSNTYIPNLAKAGTTPPQVHPVSGFRWRLVIFLENLFIDFQI